LKIIMEFRNRLQERHFANKLLNTPVTDDLLLLDVFCEFHYCSFKTIKRARFLRTSIMEPLGGNSLLLGQSALRWILYDY